MNIGLIDVDGHNFPNVALMKISSYHKHKGNNVEFIKENGEYDIVYKSKIFSYSDDTDKNNDSINYTCNKIIKGGTGYDLTTILPHKIEDTFPDYSIYPQYEYAVGYMTRGCPRKCPFCIVGDKEGTISYKVSDLDGFYNSKNNQTEIKLLDPNITACESRIDLLNQIVDLNDKNKKIKIDFTQGLDIRFMNDEISDLILNMNIKMLHFAYDRMNQSSIIEKNLKRFKDKSGFKRNKVSVFVLVNYETNIEEDFYRLEFIRKLNFQPYVMIYDKHKLKKGKSIYFKMQRWVNNPRFFWKYEDFNKYKKDHYKG